MISVANANQCRCRISLTTQKRQFRKPHRGKGKVEHAPSHQHIGRRLKQQIEADKVAELNAKVGGECTQIRFCRRRNGRLSVQVHLAVATMSRRELWWSQGFHVIKGQHSHRNYCARAVQYYVRIEEAVLAVVAASHRQIDHHVQRSIACGARQAGQRRAGVRVRVARN